VKGDALSVDYSRYKSLKISKDEKVGIVAIDHPESQNRNCPALHAELETIWRDMSADEDVNVWILTGTGDLFSAGVDREYKKRRFLDRDRSLGSTGTLEQNRIVVRDLLEVRQPIIAAVNGDAASLGASIALLCDIIVAGENVRFWDSHVTWGLVAGDGGAIIWPLHIGIAKAKEYLLSGNYLTAPEAERLGLINKVVPDGEVLDAALKFARRMAELPPLGVQWTKLCINKKIKEDVNLISEVGLALEGHTQRSKPHHELIREFYEGRDEVSRFW
jgi:enoyl-CoA hydratase